MTVCTRGDLTVLPHWEIRLPAPWHHIPLSHIIHVAHNMHNCRRGIGTSVAIEPYLAPPLMLLQTNFQTWWRQIANCHYELCQFDFTFYWAIEEVRRLCSSPVLTIPPNPTGRTIYIDRVKWLWTLRLTLKLQDTVRPKRFFLNMPLYNYTGLVFYLNYPDPEQTSSCHILINWAPC